MRFDILNFPCAMAAFVFAAVMVSPAMANDVAVTDAWIRALPVGTDAGYFTLKNSRRTKLVLTSAASPACGMLMLHRTSTTNGITHMAMVATVDVPAGAEVKFEPNGYHLMCDRPRPVIKPGAKVPVTLGFEDGTKTTVDFVVKSATGE